MNVGIVGLGFVGNAIKKSFLLKKKNILCYDKYINKYNDINVLNKCQLLFLCLPTCFDEYKKKYDISAIEEVCCYLMNNSYNGLVVIKSTIEPETTFYLTDKYNLKFIHNPEFLTAKTAFHDFHNQSHIVIGKSKNILNEDVNIIKNFYKTNYPNADISICSSLESESMKIYINSFYSVKIQFFNELYKTCQKNGSDFNNIKNLMLKNGWINPMHTNVPGTDGKLSYGGYCFPKDTNALLQYMIKKNVKENCILKSSINERNSMRDDNLNIK